jgi:aconitate hydratase
MGLNIAEKLIKSHLIEGKMEIGEEIGLRVDQTLTQDATGTMVMLELEAMELDRAKTEVSVQYVDHNLIRADFKNSDDHLFLYTGSQRFGLWFSRPGNGVSHPLHMERFGIPGKSLLGSDSHTPAAGSLGMLAIGAGGLEVALAIAGKPLFIQSPAVWGVKLTGKLSEWVSAKDVILEMLRRHDVKGGVNRIIEYYGPGVNTLTAMDRHVICNMGTELGATSSIFPADNEVKKFLASQGRVNDYIQLSADENCDYDYYEEIELSEIEPLIALPSSPGNVKPVADVAGEEILQSYVGSSANPGLRDFGICALMLKEKKVQEKVSYDVNPTTRQILENLVEMGLYTYLIRGGARIHEPGCNGCIGMGQAPPTNGRSLRTVPRNFPDRSGTEGDMVYLCSPETATASAITGVITDPRNLGMTYPIFKQPEQLIINTSMLVPPPTKCVAIDLRKGPNIKSLPKFVKLPNTFNLKVVLKVGDNISTDEIMPAGAKVLPFRSNVPEISKFVFKVVDESFYERAIKFQSEGFAIIGGENYGQGSSREHAALAPRYMGLRLVIARSYARIHWENLINFGVLPLTFENPDDWNKIHQGDTIRIDDIINVIQNGNVVKVINRTTDESYNTKHVLSDRQIKAVIAGSLINLTPKIENRLCEA